MFANFIEKQVIVPGQQGEVNDDGIKNGVGYYSGYNTALIDTGYIGVWFKAQQTLLENAEDHFILIHDKDVFTLHLPLLEVGLQSSCQSYVKENCQASVLWINYSQRVFIVQSINLLRGLKIFSA